MPPGDGKCRRDTSMPPGDISIPAPTEIFLSKGGGGTGRGVCRHGQWPADTGVWVPGRPGYVAVTRMFGSGGATEVRPCHPGTEVFPSQQISSRRNKNRAVPTKIFPCPQKYSHVIDISVKRYDKYIRRTPGVGGSRTRRGCCPYGKYPGETRFFPSGPGNVAVTRICGSAGAVSPENIPMSTEIFPGQQYSFRPHKNRPV